MASARIPFNKTLPMGVKLDSMLRHLTEARKLASEMGRVIAKYQDGNADIETDLGIASGQVQAFKDILARAAAELAGTVIIQLNVNDQSFARQLADAMG